MKSNSSHQTQPASSRAHGARSAHAQAPTPESAAAHPTDQTPPAPTADSAAPASTPDPSAELAATLAERTADLQRTRADFENFRKQTELQKQQAITVARYATVEKFLPLIDDLDRALSAYPDQLSPLKKSITKTIHSLGLERINSEPGTEFNPDLHEAVSVTDEGGDREVIAATLRPGYLYEGSVLRPTMVQVKRVAK